MQGIVSEYAHSIEKTVQQEGRRFRVPLAYWAMI